MTLRPWAHRAVMSGTLTVVVVGAMTVEGLVLRGTGQSPGWPPGAFGGPSASASAPPSRPHHTAQPRARVTVSPEPGSGAHLVAAGGPQPQPETSPTPPSPATHPSPAPASSGPPSSSQPSTPPPASTSPVAPSAEASVCPVNLLGISVCVSNR